MGLPPKKDKFLEAALISTPSHVMLLYPQVSVLLGETMFLLLMPGFSIHRYYLAIHKLIYFIVDKYIWRGAEGKINPLSLALLVHVL